MRRRPKAAEFLIDGSRSAGFGRSLGELFGLFRGGFFSLHALFFDALGFLGCSLLGALALAIGAGGCFCGIGGALVCDLVRRIDDDVQPIERRADALIIGKVDARLLAGRAKGLHVIGLAPGLRRP